MRSTSSFRPTYNLAVNLVRRHTREAAYRLVSSSFAQFLSDEDLAGELDAVLGVLERRGYLDGWKVDRCRRPPRRALPRGRPARRRGARGGRARRARSGEPGGVVSGFCYEARRERDAPFPEPEREGRTPPRGDRGALRGPCRRGAAGAPAGAREGSTPASRRSSTSGPRAATSARSCKRARDGPARPKAAAGHVRRRLRPQHEAGHRPAPPDGRWSRDWTRRQELPAAAAERLLRDVVAASSVVTIPVERGHHPRRWTAWHRNVVRACRSRALSGSPPPNGSCSSRYFTNLDGPVFALVNLPEVVKGALFARYSRSSKSLRRLFLDEFVDELDVAGDTSLDASVGLRRAEELYARVFSEYGDDSVAQLGGVHLACEQSSNVLTKILEWGRLMAYLEQSTRYIPYDIPPPVRALPLPPRPRRPRVAARPSLRRRDGPDVRHLRRAPAGAADLRRQGSPRRGGVSELAHRQAVRARCLDALRGLLPAGSLSNVGIFGSGQSYELLLLRMRGTSLARGPPVRRDDPRRAAQGDPVVSHQGRPCPSAAGCGPSTCRTAARRWRPSSRSCGRSKVARTRDLGDSHRLRPRRGGQGARGDVLSRISTFPRRRSRTSSPRSGQTSGGPSSRRT